MKKLNSNLLLHFMTALFVLQNASAIEATDIPNSIDSDTQTIAKTTQEEFDLNKAIQANNLEKIQAELNVRQLFLSEIKGKLCTFINAIKPVAEEFENDMMKEKGIKRIEVQNLSIVHGGLNKQLKAKYPSIDKFINTIGKGDEEGKPFYMLVNELESYLKTEIPTYASQLKPAFDLIISARIPCAGCADSIYHLSLLINQAIDMLIQNPFRPLPESVMSIFNGIKNKARIEINKRYLPHSIKIADSLDNLDAKLNETSAKEGNRVLTSQDISRISEVIKRLYSNTKYNSDKSAMYNALEKVNKYEGKILNELSLALKKDLENNIAMYNIFILVIQHVLFLPQQNVKKIDSSRIAAFARPQIETITNQSTERTSAATAGSSVPDISFTPTQEQLNTKINKDGFNLFMEKLEKLHSEARAINQASYKLLMSRLQNFSDTNAKMTIADIVNIIDTYAGKKIMPKVKSALFDYLNGN